MSINVCHFGIPLRSRFYDTALVLSVPPEMAALVRFLRAKLEGKAARGLMLEPHVTVLYLGGMTGEQLAGMMAWYCDFAGREFRAEVEGLDCFRSGETIANVHIRLRSDEIEEFHRQLFNDAMRRGLAPDTSYALRNYRPHISLVDQIAIAPAAVEPFLSLSIPQDTIFAGDLHFMADGSGER